MQIDGAGCAVKSWVVGTIARDPNLVMAVMDVYTWTMGRPAAKNRCSARTATPPPQRTAMTADKAVKSSMDKAGKLPLDEAGNPQLEKGEEAQLASRPAQCGFWTKQVNSYKCVGRTRRAAFVVNGCFAAFGVNVVVALVGLNVFFGALAINSFFSFASINSVLSIASANCILCAGCVNSFLCMAPGFFGKAV